MTLTGGSARPVASGGAEGGSQHRPVHLWLPESPSRGSLRHRYIDIPQPSSHANKGTHQS